MPKEWRNWQRQRCLPYDRIDEQVLRQFIARMRRLYGLPARPAECLYLTLCGYTALPDVAKLMAVSTETVRDFRKRVRQVLDVPSLESAVAQVWRDYAPLRGLSLRSEPQGG